MGWVRGAPLTHVRQIVREVTRLEVLLVPRRRRMHLCRVDHLLRRVQINRLLSCACAAAVACATSGGAAGCAAACAAAAAFLSTTETYREFRGCLQVLAPPGRQMRILPHRARVLAARSTCFRLAVAYSLDHEEPPRTHCEHVLT